MEGLDHCKTVYYQSLLYVGSLDRDQSKENKRKFRNTAKTGQTTCKRRKYNISTGQHQPSSMKSEFTWSLHNEPGITGHSYVMCKNYRKK